MEVEVSMQFQLSVYGFFELRRRRTDRQTRDICSTGSDVCSCGLAAGTAIADAAQNLKRKKISIKTLTTIRTCTRDKGVRTVGMGLFRKPPPFCERIIRDGRAGMHCNTNGAPFQCAAVCPSPCQPGTATRSAAQCMQCGPASSTGACRRYPHLHQMVLETSP